jgi:saccharopine dehydrogenase (NAD+, L-lysine-forming)
MRILICGGGGEEGSGVAKDLIQFYGSRISKIVVGDVDLDRANRTFGAAGSDKVSVQYLDISDHRQLVGAIKKVDIVINCVGPFFRWGAKVLKAAIEAGKDYLDIDDDSESTLEKLCLDDEARAAGVTAIIGLGSGPGSDNLLARHAAEKLDRVDEINIYWVVNGRLPGSRLAPKGAMLHAYYGIQKAGPQYINGKLMEMPPLSGATVVDFDPPVGRAEVVYFGHPEPVTLPRYIKGVKTVTNRGGILPSYQMRIIREAVDLGLTRDEPLEIAGAHISPIEYLYVLQRTFVPDQYPGEFPMSGIKIEVRGEKDGKPQEYIYGSSTKSMAGATAAPVAIGVLMIYDGDIKKKGVFAPEGCIDNFGKFMSELAKRSI